MDWLLYFLLSFLPPRYRGERRHESRAQIVAAAGISGFVQMMFFGAFYIAAFLLYLNKAFIPQVAFLEYFFYPPSWPLAFFWMEGLFRMLASIAGQAVGTFPLYLVAWTHTWLERRAARAQLGEKIIDLVEPGDGVRYALRISSCRPKPNWDHLMTIMVEEKLYEIAAQETGALPRPYVYLLRPRPDHKALRGLHRYSPREVLFTRDD